MLVVDGDDGTVNIGGEIGASGGDGPDDDGRLGRDRCIRALNCPKHLEPGTWKRTETQTQCQTRGSEKTAVSTGPPTRLLAPLTHSRARGKVNELMEGYQAVLNYGGPNPAPDEGLAADGDPD